MTRYVTPVIPATPSRMFAEAAEAPDAVARQLAAGRARLADYGATLRATPPRTVMTCARGSSDHAATYLKHLVETRAGVLVASAAPSIASLYDRAPVDRDVLAIALSQSGSSPDLLATMAGARDASARTLAMINVIDAPLAGLADTVMPLHAGPETSVAATKSCIATLAACVALVAAWTDDAELTDALATLPADLRAAWSCDWTPLVEQLAGVAGLYVIGRGPGFGIAQEMALKFKETCGLHAEAFSAAEVRHGPMALVGPGFPLLVLRQDDASATGTDALIADALDRGATVLVAAADPPASGAIHLPQPSSSAVIAPVIALQAFYRAAEALARARGHDPDRPPHLSKVTETV